MERRELTINEFRNRLIEESQKKKILLSATVEITSLCCFKCPHCYMDNTTPGFMSLKSFKKIIKELKSLGCIYLTITGGEAILHPMFKEMYLMAYNSGFIISLFSNGYFIDKVIDLLSDYKPYEVDITLYGVDNESYLKNTCVPDGEKVFYNLKLLKERNITFSLKAAVTKNILPYVDIMHSLSKKFGVTFRTDMYIYLSRNQSARVERLTPREIASQLLQNEKYIELEKDALKDSYSEKETLLYGCHPGETNIYITWDEKAKICPFTSEEHSFSIKEPDKSINMARDYFQKLGSRTISEDSKCYKCKFLSACRRCPERFFIENETYVNPPCWMCETAEFIYNGIL